AEPAKRDAVRASLNAVGFAPQQISEADVTTVTRDIFDNGIPLGIQQNLALVDTVSSDAAIITQFLSVLDAVGLPVTFPDALADEGRNEVATNLAQALTDFAVG